MKRAASYLSDMEQQSPELLELERQLSHPSGAKGIEVAAMMHATNIGMTTAAIDRLQLGSGMSVMELGPGNGGHLPYLLRQAAGLHYTGLEISETMLAEASRINSAAIAGGAAEFQLYDGRSIPSADLAVDRLFSVNCIYFWTDAGALLTEIHRVLKPGGIAAIAFAHKSFMQGLPFIGDRFRLYDPEDFTALVSGTPFLLEGLHTQTETVRTRTGEEVERAFSVGLLRKHL